MTTIILILFIISYIFCLISFKATLFFFILFLPLNSILPKEYNIFGLFSYVMVYSFFVFYHYIKNKNIRIKGKLAKDPVISVTSLVFLSYLVMEIYGNVRDYYNYGLFISQLDNIIIIILRIIIKIIAYLIIIRQIKYNINISIYATIISIVLIIFSIIFYNQLDAIGIRLEEGDILNYKNPIESRVAGIYSGGDVNSLGVMYNIFIAFLLSLSSINKKKLSIGEILIIFICILGIAFTASRMAIVSLLLVIISAIRRLSLINYLNIIIVILILFILIYFNIFNYVIERIKSLGLIQQVSPQGGGRYERWMIYIKEIFSSPRNMFLGYTNVVYFYGVINDPHNFIIRSIYLNGIILTILWLYSFIKSYILFGKNIGYINNLRIFLPIIINILIISQIGAIYNFYILLLILYYRTYKVNAYI